MCVPRLETALCEVKPDAKHLCISFSNIAKQPLFYGFYEYVGSLSNRFSIPDHIISMRPKRRNNVPMKVDNVAKVTKIADPVSFEKLYVVPGLNQRGFIPAGTVFKRDDWSDFISLEDEQKSIKKPINIFKSANKKSDYTLQKAIDNPSDKDLAETVGSQKSFMELQKKILRKDQTQPKKKRKKNSNDNGNKSNGQNLFNYITLNVHKVQSNPNKIKKKKKKKQGK